MTNSCGISIGGLLVGRGNGVGEGEGEAAGVVLVEGEVVDGGEVDGEVVRLRAVQVRRLHPPQLYEYPRAHICDQSVFVCLVMTEKK